MRRGVRRSYEKVRTRTLCCASLRMPHHEETEFGEDGWVGKNAMRCDGVILLLPACLPETAKALYVYAREVLLLLCGP